MRTFTEKDKAGLARALQTFMGYMNAQRVHMKSHMTQVERALSEGLTADEILNRANYLRVAAIIENASLEDYVTALIERKAVVRSLKDDEGWDDSLTFEIIANFFHDFCLEAAACGGTYNTANAKINLMRAIKRNSLQALMSEKLLNEVADRSGKGDSLTCYQYVSEILARQEDYEIDNTLSEAQKARREVEESFLDADGNDNNDTESAGEQEYAPSAVRNVEINTEGMPKENDQSIFGPTDGTDINEDIFSVEPTDGVFIASVNPKLHKRNILRDAIFGLSISKFAELAKAAESDSTIDEFITDLSDGRYRDYEESAKAHNAHQYLNGELYPRFLECVRLQGIVIDEQTASNIDLLNEPWDFRDDKTRKLQKIKELIYKETDPSEDPDLEAIIKDLEEYYSM